MANYWLNGMMGLVLGDVLGMPVQFKSREEIKKCPIEKVEGYGTYNKPPGTWSDDSSMALATLVSLQEKKNIDCQDIMERFVGWLNRGEYTPMGRAFDMGRTCAEAIDNYVESQNYQTCGKTGERANGNGALMRILPVCLYARDMVENGNWIVEEAIEGVHLVSALTHNHLRSKIACGIYFFMICKILEGSGTLQERLQGGMDDAIKFYRGEISNDTELAHYGRLFHLEEFAEVPEEAIKSSGYVVDSLEAAVWSLITTDSFDKALLKAVNLGDDTDTVGAIAGGLAGLYYGYESMPKEWLETVIKREWIEGLCDL